MHTSNSRLAFLSIVSLIGLIQACSPGNQPQAPVLKSGTWRAVIQSPGGELPFGLEIVANPNSSTYTVYALNGQEKLRLDTATVKQDSVHIPMAVFDAEITAHLSDGRLTGRYVKFGYNTRTELPFQATFGEAYRFAKGSDTAPTKASLSGRWATTFIGKDGKDTTRAVGIFNQQGNHLTGTFLTTTGDYRFLAGDVLGDTMYLSCFDGNHVYLFKAHLNNNGQQLINGEFWSGKSGYESWTAVKDDSAALPDANTLTFLKPGNHRIDFTFPNPEGQAVSLRDDAYKNKVVIVQIMGSWCPNCMDETNFLSPWYKKNRARGVEIIGLAYEKNPDFAVSAPKLKRLINRFGIEYSVLLAGQNDKEKASLTLPMLNRILAFPTTIFIDKKGIVRKIHTGFSGPGTGEYYTKFVEEFEQFVDKLLEEPVPIETAQK